MDKLFDENSDDMSVKDMQAILKEIGGFHTLKCKSSYIDRINNFKKVLNFTWREDQKKVINEFLNFNHRVYVVHALYGSGKCHAKDTKIMLFDGTVKNVQDVKVGDLLMGDDSTPRKVLSLARGVDKMYEIIPKKGDKYIVNEPHILCLKVSGYPCITHQEHRHAHFVNWVDNNKMVSKSFTYKKDSDEDKLLKKQEAQMFLNNIKNEQILEISVQDYLNIPKSIKPKLLAYKVKVDFTEKELSFDPYIIGYWLGNGTSDDTIISTQDSTVLHYLYKNLYKYKLILTYVSKYDYNINRNKKKGCNIFLKELQDLNMINNKHIPNIYKCNSRENRLKLLAGIIDSDGYLNSNGGYEFTQKNEKLMDDVIYLCRSLGFSCYKKIKKTKWTYKGEKKTGQAFRIQINGNGIEEIPVLVPRKKSNPRKQVKDELTVGISKVNYIGEDNYYGFTIDGNSRYLMGDFTVTHNTTLLLGLLIHGILKRLFKSDEILFISYNISIKNEIKRKLKDYGISNKVIVRTFDSIIYEIAKAGDYPHIDLPNFEGKRKFVHELVYKKEFDFKPEFQPKIIFVDECQDLEKSVLEILKYFYPETKFVFAGDIFQSIQKETRESVLWHFMTIPEHPEIYKIYMSDTPRVPVKTLETIKTALQIHYPEFKDKIYNWTSSNTISTADIEWRKLNSYTHIFEELKTFLSSHSPTESMILTFSSAITVKGAMGDIARFRRFFSENGIDVNTNHKKMDPNKYFLTTANSSKGLERDYVIVFLTFPLERAFVTLSDDIVINLITVALTRAKKKVIMFVPAFEDKYSRSLSLFETCPKPDKGKIKEGKLLKEFTVQDYLDNEHSVTEIIRSSIIKYDTRILIRNNIKPYNFSKIFDENTNYKTLPIITEEDKAFVGILIENLITSTWVSRWPTIPSDDISKNNPMYSHISNRIKSSINKYKQFTTSNIFNEYNQFDGILLYSQIHIALSNKIFMSLTESLTNNLKNYWKTLKPKAMLMKPCDTKLKIQCNLKMPWLTGVADAYSIDEDEKTTSLYEIKASSSMDWKDDASVQIFCYALMCGKTWSRLHLLNPFRNEKISYYFDSKSILSLRMHLIQDILICNINSMMAKLYSETNCKDKLNVSDTMFIHILKDEKGDIKQASILNILSPIKCEFVYNKYVCSDNKKTKDMKKDERFACESEFSEEEIINELNEILNSNINKNKNVWGFENYSDIVDKDIYSIKDEFELENVDDIIKSLNYVKNPELKYSLDTTDSFYCNILCLTFMFLNNHFV
jgi:hypothetical protein